MRKKKYGSKFGTIMGWSLTALFLLGLVITFWAAKGSEELGKPGSGRLTAGLLMMGAAVLVISSLPLLPAKLRGVDEVPKKIRVIQVFTTIFLWAALGGFAVLAYNCVQEPQNTLWCCIGAGIFLAAFAGLWLVTSIRDKLIERGEAKPDADVIMRAESDIHESEFGKELINKVLGVGDERLSEEERESELQRIEEQDRKAGVVTMTKEQVEEYENRKHFL